MMKSVVVTGVTFGVFLTEALIHYNMGQAQAEGELRFRLPPPKEMAKIAAVTAVFSVSSGLLISRLDKGLPKLRI